MERFKYSQFMSRQKEDHNAAVEQMQAAIDATDVTLKEEAAEVSESEAIGNAEQTEAVLTENTAHESPVQPETVPSVPEEIKEEKSVSLNINDGDSFKRDIAFHKAGNNASDVQMILPPVQDNDEDDTVQDKATAADSPEKVVDRREQIKRARSRASDDVKMSCLKKVPTALVERVQSMFDTKGNSVPMDVAVSAYIYIKENYPEDVIVSDKISEVLDIFSEKAVSNQDLQQLLKQQMVHLRKQNDELRAENRRLLEQLDTIETAILYVIFENAGFRKKDQFSPGEVDFLEIGMEDLRKRLDLQSSDRRERIRHREGSSHNYK